jgi:DNA-binding transcriptional ArsR family regulator
MKAVLIEDGDNGKKIAHNSLVIDDPKIFSALDNPISLKILKTLAETPNSGMNISRKLRIDEQKIYYYLRKLEKAGIIYPISSEKHRGMVSQIYTIVSPVISAKLVDNGVEVKNVGKVMPPDTAEFFAPFVENGSINCKIIIGNTKTHGKYEARAVDSPYLIDFLLFLGSMTHNFDHSHISYRFDTDVTDDELKNNNLILIGNPKINSVTDRINSYGLSNNLQNNGK